MTYTYNVIKALDYSSSYVPCMNVSTRSVTNLLCFDEIGQSSQRERFREKVSGYECIDSRTALVPCTGEILYI